jgi:hypothetical protein
MSNTQWVLWIVKASNSKYGEITHVYARDEQHARERARNWVEVHPHLPEVQFKAYPHGFQIVRGRLPGMISIEDEQ